MTNKILLFILCLVALNTKGQNNEAVATEVNKINKLLSEASLKTKTDKRYDYISIYNGELIVTDSIFMRGYDKNFELYLKKHHVLLKDIADIVFEKKIAAYWGRIVLKPEATSYKYFNYEGKEEINKDGIIFIFEKSFGKGDGPAQLKEAFKKLLTAAGFTPLF